MEINSELLIKLGKLSQIEACIQYPDIARQLDKSGVYAIKLCNEVVYVGQAHVLFLRMLTHAKNLQAKKLNEAKDYRKYKLLKSYLNDVTLEVLTFTRNIDKEEKKYIRQYNPIFNIMKPEGHRYFNGTIEDIDDFVAGLSTMEDLRELVVKYPTWQSTEYVL